MKLRLLLILATAIAVAACSRGTRDELPPPPKPRQGSLVQPTAVYAHEHKPSQAIVETAAFRQYMVRGTWHWDERRHDAVRCSADSGCPLPAGDALRGQQVLGRGELKSESENE